MKKAVKIVYISLFFAICAIPAVIMPFYKNNTSSTENRELAEKPSILKNNKINMDFPTEFEAYVSDHFGFRTKLVTVNSLLQAKIFGLSSEESVIYGSDGWLFFKKTLDDYLGRNNLSEKELLDIIGNLELMQEYCISKDSKFLFTVSPNKNTLYPQYMPNYYVKENEKGNLDLLTEKLKNSNVNYLDFVDIFSKQNEILYQKLDSHWNNKGAVLAYNSIMDNLGIEHETYADTPYTIRKDWDGDLYGMLFPSLNEKDEQIYYNHEFEYQYISRYRSPDDIIIKTANPNKNNNLLMFRDSFGNTLHPFMAESFAQAQFMRAMPYRFDTLNNFNANYVVLEIVERNLSMLREVAPVLPAPLRDVDLSNALLKTSDENTIQSALENSYLKLWGTLDSSYFEGGENIYINLTNGEDNYFYEAFSTCEADEEKDGFSIYIDTNPIKNSDYDVYIFIEKENHITNCGNLGKLSLPIK